MPANADIEHSTGPSRARSGWRALARAFAIAAGAGLLAVAAGGSAVWRFTEHLGPLDLSPAGELSTVALDREGRLLRAFTTAGGRWRLPIAASDVDPHYLAMLIACEDRRFENHPGVDPLATFRAAAQNAAAGRVVSGASTLTMQVARLIEPREERSLAAKLRQILRALQIERHLAKWDILSLYLALAPYGGNIEGVRAASLAYFGKEPKRLSHAEAALLVALPQSPETRRPDRWVERARRARDRVLDIAVLRGVIGVEDAAVAKAEAVPQRRRPVPMLAAHATEAAHKLDPDERALRLTIDAPLQERLESLLSDRVVALGPKLSGAVIVVDNRTGEVRAYVGSAGYLAVERAGAIDAAQAVRSPGSALKPFVYAFAFEDGIAHPETVLEDRPSRYGPWVPENFDQSHQGMVTARRALQQSLNVPAVELLSEFGPARFLARLRGAGADIAVPRDSTAGLALGLGGLGIRLTDLARLYAGLARGGDVLPLVWRHDEAAWAQRGSATGRRLTDTVAAWYVADILKGAPPPLNAAPGRIAFKTGTSYGHRDAWSVGFDRRYTVAVWIGRPDGSSVPGLVGRDAAAPILFDAFARIGGEPEQITAPRGALFATSATLPPPLRHLRKDAPKTAGASRSAQLKISFPLDGSRVDLGAGGDTSTDARLALKAMGGILPLTWFVNGAPLGSAEIRRESSWKPDGAGFARVSVMDSLGSIASVVVRIE